MSKGKLCSREASAEGPFVGAVIEARGSSKNAEREILVVSHSGMEMRGTLFLGRDCVVVEMTLLRKVTVTPGPMVKIWVTKRGNFLVVPVDLCSPIRSESQRFPIATGVGMSSSHDPVRNPSQVMVNII